VNIRGFRAHCIEKRLLVAFFRQVERHCRWKDARRLVETYVAHYNNVRLNSAVGYITPKDMLAGRQEQIQAERSPLRDSPHTYSRVSAINVSIG
jgi:hypothetical protein